MSMSELTTGYSGGVGNYSAKVETKGTAVDSVNANLETITNRIMDLTRFAGRISDGILGVVPAPSPAIDGPRPVTQSTQDHIRDLEAAVERLSGQINRLC